MLSLIKSRLRAIAEAQSLKEKGAIIRTIRNECLVEIAKDWHIPTEEKDWNFRITYQQYQIIGTLRNGKPANGKLYDNGVEVPLTNQEKQQIGQYIMDLYYG